MRLAERLVTVRSIFIDTAPIIYYIEAHPQFGPLAQEVVVAFQSGSLQAFTSVLTLLEVLPKPIAKGEDALSKKFSDFLKYGKNFTLVEISTNIAELAGELRGKYSFLKAIDAIQLATAITIKSDIFLTNDIKLKQFREIEVVILKDYLEVTKD